MMFTQNAFGSVQGTVELKIVVTRIVAISFAEMLIRYLVINGAFRTDDFSYCVLFAKITESLPLVL